MCADEGLNDTATTMDRDALGGAQASQPGALPGVKDRETPMDRDQIPPLVLETLAEVAPEADLAQLNPDVAFHDQLDIDSVDFLNFVLALERKLGISIPEGDYPRLGSLAGATECVSRLLDKNAGATTS